MLFRMITINHCAANMTATFFLLLLPQNYIRAHIWNGAYSCIFTLFFIGIAARGELHAGALGAVALALLGLRVFRRERVVASDR